MTKTREVFTKKLIEASVSDNLTDALNEWEYSNYHSEINYCICGQKLKHNILIRNINNGNEIVVGCNCIQKFDGKIKNKFNIDLDVLMTSYIKVKKNIYAFFDLITLRTFSQNDKITEEEYDKYKKTTSNIIKSNIDFNFVKKLNEKILSIIEDKPMITTDRECYEFNFGKYKGKKYNEVLLIDKKYVDWVESKCLI